MCEELKPCPFCGSEDVVKNLGISLVWTVGCNKCGCRTAEYFLAIDAVDSWNRRANNTDEPRRISEIMSDMMPMIDSMPEMVDQKCTPF